jgi:hypothetical protein
MNPNKLDEYAMRPKNPQPLFIRTAENLGETQTDIRRIKMVPRYDNPPWKSVNGKQFDVSAFGPGTSSTRYRMETKTVANTSRYIQTDRRWETKYSISVVKEEHTIKKRILLVVFSAELSAIIAAI